MRLCESLECSAMTLRRLYFIDAWLMLAVGFLFFGYSNAPEGSSLFGINVPGEYSEHMSEWRANSFAGTFGGALMAFGFATLAIAGSRDARVHRSASGYLLAGHFFLAFIVL